MRWPDRSNIVTLPSRNNVDMKMWHCLSRRLTVGLNDIQTLGLNRASNCAGDSDGRPGEQPSSVVVQRPDVGDVTTRHNERMPERRWLCRKECHYMLIPVDHPSFGV